MKNIKQKFRNFKEYNPSSCSRRIGKSDGCGLDLPIQTERVGDFIFCKILIWLLAGLMLIGLLSLSSISFAKEGKWIKKTDMPIPRNGLSTAVVNGKIYAIGGWDGANILATVEEYNPKTSTWIKKADMPAERYGLATSVVKGKIYAIGGAIEATVLSIVAEYNPATNTWTKKASMPTARNILSASAVNGKIYAIGGESNVRFSAISAVEEYTPEGWPFSISPEGKLPATWGEIKHSR